MIYAMSDHEEELKKYGTTIKKFDDHFVVTKT